jgi:hypothetical protein
LCALTSPRAKYDNYGKVAEDGHFKETSPSASLPESAEQEFRGREQETIDRVLFSPFPLREGGRGVRFFFHVLPERTSNSLRIVIIQWKSILSHTLYLEMDILP